MSSTMGRRAFMGAGAGVLILRPETVRGMAANSAVRLGLLGCGNRGTTVATAFAENTIARVVALADLFPDQLEKAAKHFNAIAAQKGYAGVDSSRMFRGPKAYRAIAESHDIDMVLITTPDYFHPEHLEAVVDAGKHVYCEKPAAVDVAGVRRFIEIGKRAEGRLSLDVGFNVRHAAPFYETVHRIQAGAIGKVAFASAFYHAPAITYPPRPHASALERRIRNFYWDRVLSGDVIVDQNIHIIDICNWVLGARPERAIGTGGRKVRNEPGGDIWDHFAVTFHYPGEAKVNFNSVQFGSTFWDVGCRFFGDKGVAECYYSGLARIIGPESWEWQRPGAQAPAGQGFSTAGSFSGLQNAEAHKAQAFIDSITSGKFHNESAAGAESALSAILGRSAAYAAREVTWDEMMSSNQSYAGAVDLTPLEHPA